MASKRTKTTKSKAKAAPKKARVSKSTMLSKSKNDRMISGVIGGIAKYLNIDSTILRLAWIAVVAFTGFLPGIIAYGLAMIVMPEE